MQHIETVIVGAGVVGLAISKTLAESGREVLVIEQAEKMGMGISSRNSEVLHAGIYYPPGSFKARFCVAGRRWLYRYCTEREIPHRKITKLIVATSAEQIPHLQQLLETSRANGLVGPEEELVMLSRSQARHLEPELDCAAALLSPATGIIDSHSLMMSFRSDAERAGATFVFKTCLQRVERKQNKLLIYTRDERDNEYQFAAKELVNAAGLAAQDVARSIAGLSQTSIPEQLLVKGNYFVLSGVRSPFSRLIYPLPSSLGLGIHVTVDLSGQARFGPDDQPVKQIDYAVDNNRALDFYRAIRQYWPALPDQSLQPGYAGIRPKLKTNDERSADFCIKSPADHGIPGLVNLFGIESPGLTATPALAEHVRCLLDQG